ncbi:MAG: NAD-dependent epimerase/dehydratase family protein [Gammaproteobacteria bacterium]|nr:MAG: NAD-dependent epimerase/dehydratase family protein [Gammaproteobacteria bacterium]
MKIIILGATGMVGQAVLRECLLASDVELITSIGRTAFDNTDPKIKQITVPDLMNASAQLESLRDYDACFFCLGVSASGKTEAEYSHLNFEIPLTIATALSKHNSNMTFVYVSGAGTDSTEQGKTMWARVKGKTENALLTLPFKATYLFRPGVIRPLHGIRSKTKAYYLFYLLANPLLGLLKFILPEHILSTDIIGKAMLEVARHGAPTAILESPDLYKLAQEKS